MHINQFSLEPSITRNLWSLILSVLHIVTDFRLTSLIDSPSICICVIYSSFGSFIFTSNGPLPWKTFYPERNILSRASRSSFLKLTNYTIPSSTFCSLKSAFPSDFLMLTFEIDLVCQTFRRPAI